MAVKPVRLLCYMTCFCGPDGAQRSIAFPAFLLTNSNVPLIYSVAICQQKTKDCAPLGSFQHKLQHCFFI